MLVLFPPLFPSKQNLLWQLGSWAARGGKIQTSPLPLSRPNPLRIHARKTSRRTACTRDGRDEKKTWWYRPPDFQLWTEYGSRTPPFGRVWWWYRWLDFHGSPKTPHFVAIHPIA
jgi:hypothetical protein